MARGYINWLTAWCGAVAVFGLVIAGAAFETTQGPTLWLLHRLNGSVTPEVTPALRFSLALLGAVTIGWSLTMLIAVRAADLLGPRGEPVWRAIAAGLVIWFIIDSLLSALTGFGLNVVSNAVFLTVFLAPLLLGGGLRAPNGGRASEALAAG